MNRRLIPVLLVAALGLAACGPGDVLVFDELPFPVIDMSESDDPAVRASSEAWEETLATQDADAALDRAIEGNDLEAAREASELKPDDPKYPIYEQYLTTEETLDQICVIESVDDNSAGGAGSERGNCAENPSAYDRRQDLTTEALQRTHARYPDWSITEKKRHVMELQLDALRDLINSQPDSELRGAWLFSYCGGLTRQYPQTFADEFPAETAIFIGGHTAAGGLSVCEE